MRAVILVVALALWTLQARPDLSADTDAVANLHSLDFRSNQDSLTNNFVTDANGKRSIAPAAVDGMNVRSADTAAFNLNVNIVVTELLGFELIFSQNQFVLVGNGCCLPLAS